MRVLILTITAGQGHNQTSNAMAECFRARGHECQIIDAYRFINRALSGSVEKGYLAMTKYTPKVYGEMYRLMVERETISGEAAIKKLSNTIIAGKLIKYINEYAPDAIICTHVLPARILTDLKYKLLPVITVGVITDFTLHPYWEETELDYYVTPSHLLNNQFKKRGIPEEKLMPFGIPIQPKFSERRTKEAAKMELGIPDKNTILVMMGSMGFGNVAKLIADIDGIPHDFQILCVCGRNRKAKKRIDEMTTKHTVFNYGYVNNVDVLMDASELIVTKPGGLSVSESLAKGLYMILIHPIPGQEDRNLEFLSNNGVASCTTPTLPVDEAIYQYLNNAWQRSAAKDAISYLGKPNAATDLCEFLEKQVNVHGVTDSSRSN